MVKTTEDGLDILPLMVTISGVVLFSRPAAHVTKSANVEIVLEVPPAPPVVVETPSLLTVAYPFMLKSTAPYAPPAIHAISAALNKLNAFFITGPLFKFGF
jgi:hypothetical protein